jgi:hypothetical protein
MFSAKPFNLRYLVSLVDAASCWLLAASCLFLALKDTPNKKPILERAGLFSAHSRKTKNLCFENFQLNKTQGCLVETFTYVLN